MVALVASFFKNYVLAFPLESQQFVKKETAMCWFLQRKLFDFHDWHINSRIIQAGAPHLCKFFHLCARVAVLKTVFKSGHISLLSLLEMRAKKISFS